MALCRKCQQFRVFNFQTWESGSAPACHDWECDRGKRNNFWLWKKRIESRDWTAKMTLTTKYRLTPDSVEKALHVFENFARTLKRHDPTLVLVRGFDINKRGFIHFNAILNGDLPKKKRIKGIWFKQTGCHHVEIQPYHSNAAYYLAKRAAELPDIKNGESPAWEGRKRTFRRVQPSLGLFVQPKPKRNDKSPWRALDTDYIELLKSLRPNQVKLLQSLSFSQLKKMVGIYSMAADTALPGKLGDTADQPSLTGAAHGHEGERQRQGVLVPDVRSHNHRRRTAGDSREPDAIRTPCSRARAGTGPGPELEEAIR